jgi:hypothetical protein
MCATRIATDFGSPLNHLHVECFNIKFCSVQKALEAQKVSASFASFINSFENVKIPLGMSLLDTYDSQLAFSVRFHSSLPF